ncbi:hypothetical protein VitviT2T_013508 [Vitis vinifera]|uniref:Uncharacterized protein n=1 Tax=Vitis vinifera TaxID=29760 RepID=A0ABY9CH71_VITVI|nr:hypothetical protein VitviT2T_013508 [Vitis vinifera]
MLACLGRCAAVAAMKRGVDSISSRRRVVVPSGAFSTASHGKTICSVHGQLVSSGRYLLVRPWAGLVASLRTFSSQGLAVAYPLLGMWSWVDRPIWETREVLFRRAGQGLIICRRSLGSYAELGYRYLILFPQSISSS